MKKKRLTCVFALGIILVCNGCSDPSERVLSSPIHKYGLMEAKLYKPMVAEAIQISNAILQDDVGIRLAPGWDFLPGENVVPVFLVREFNLAKTDVVFIPMGERFIIVNERQFIRFLENKTNDHSAILALMLLHEIGHILHGEAGSYYGSVDLSLADIKHAGMGDSDQKNRELEADSFAAYQVREAMRAKQNPTRFFAAMKIFISLVGYAFNISSDQLLEHFGDLSGSRYLKEGYTHPNYEFRLRVLSFLISPNESSMKMVTDFLEQRETAITKKSSPWNPKRYSLFGDRK